MIIICQSGPPPSSLSQLHSHKWHFPFLIVDIWLFKLGRVKGSMMDSHTRTENMVEASGPGHVWIRVGKRKRELKSFDTEMQLSRNRISSHHAFGQIVFSPLPLWPALNLAVHFLPCWVGKVLHSSVTVMQYPSSNARPCKWRDWGMLATMKPFEELQVIRRMFRLEASCGLGEQDACRSKLEELNNWMKWLESDMLETDGQRRTLILIMVDGPPMPYNARLVSQGQTFSSGTHVSTGLETRQSWTTGVGEDWWMDTTLGCVAERD